MITMDVTTTVLDSATIVTLAGELDVYSAGQVRAVIADIEATGQHRIVVDLAAVENMDSTGLAVIAGAAKRNRASGGDIALVATTETIRRVLRITGVHKSIQVFATAAEAAGHLSPEGTRQVAAPAVTEPQPQSAGSSWDPTGADADLDTILDGEYACTRVWEAWQYGTMTQDDFVPMAESEIVGDLLAWRDAAVAAAAPPTEHNLDLEQILTRHAFDTASDDRPLRLLDLADPHLRTALLAWRAAGVARATADRTTWTDPRNDTEYDLTRDWLDRDGERWRHTRNNASECCGTPTPHMSLAPDGEQRDRLNGVPLHYLIDTYGPLRPAPLPGEHPAPANPFADTTQDVT